MDPSKMAETSKDKEGFRKFLKALRDDFNESPETWNNLTLDDFLESIERWVGDYHGNDINFEKPDWRTISAMFLMGKLYE